MAQQSEFIESINIDLLKIIKLPALYTALGATINSNIIYLVKLRINPFILMSCQLRLSFGKVGQGDVDKIEFIGKNIITLVF
jgi:hypothetical protein